METEELYRHWRDRLLAYFAMRVGSEEAEDLLQELFCRYIGSLAAGVVIAHPSNWLWRTARNLVVDAYRDSINAKRATPIGLHLTELTTDENGAIEHSNSELHTRRCWLQRYLSLLTAEQCQVLVLRNWNNWQLCQVADALGLTVGAAKARHLRALHRLRSFVE